MQIGEKVNSIKSPTSRFKQIGWVFFSLASFFLTRLP
jgi:hypothetical protein